MRVCALSQVWPHPEVGTLPVDGSGHISGDAEAALYEGVGVHR